MLYKDDHVIVEEEIYINKDGLNVGILPVGLIGKVLEVRVNKFYGAYAIIEFENSIIVGSYLSNRKIRKTGGQLTGEKNLKDNVWVTSINE